QVIEDLDAYSRATLKDNQPKILTKTLGRVLVKHIAAEIAAKGAKEAAKKKNDDATAMLVGCCVGAAAHAAASGTESADTRYWALLPDRIEGALAVVPAGKHQVSIRT